MVAWLGVDVARDRLHVATLGAHGPVTYVQLAPADLDGWLRGRTIVGATVDAPSGWADDAHARDDRVARKYRRRCGEAVLARRDPPHFVSFAVPAVHETEDPAHGWVATGIAVTATLRAAGIATHETWPHAAWQRLTDRRSLPSKRTADGLALRAGVLRAAGLGLPPGAEHDHDVLDAAVAAFTAATLTPAELRAASCDDPSHPGRAEGIVLPTRATLDPPGD